VGDITLPPLGRNFLHAAKIVFSHPRTGERMEIRAPLPVELRDFLHTLASTFGGDPAKIDAALIGYL
jgi:23S rRNA pseudouridine1911/1915/1917 synthase